MSTAVAASIQMQHGLVFLTAMGVGCENTITDRKNPLLMLFSLDWESIDLSCLALGTE